MAAKSFYIYSISLPRQAGGNVHAKIPGHRGNKTPRGDSSDAKKYAQNEGTGKAGRALVEVGYGKEGSRRL